jgi:hypothetical protein
LRVVVDVDVDEEEDDDLNVLLLEVKLPNPPPLGIILLNEEPRLTLVDVVYKFLDAVDAVVVVTVDRNPRTNKPPPPQLEPANDVDDDLLNAARKTEIVVPVEQVFLIKKDAVTLNLK